MHRDELDVNRIVAIDEGRGKDLIMRMMGRIVVEKRSVGQMWPLLFGLEWLLAYYGRRMRRWENKT